MNLLFLESLKVAQFFGIVRQIVGKCRQKILEPFFSPKILENSENWIFFLRIC